MSHILYSLIEFNFKSPPADEPEFDHLYQNCISGLIKIESHLSTPQSIYDLADNDFLVLENKTETSLRFQITHIAGNDLEWVIKGLENGLRVSGYHLDPEVNVSVHELKKSDYTYTLPQVQNVAPAPKTKNSYQP